MSRRQDGLGSAHVRPSRNTMSSISTGNKNGGQFIQNGAQISENGFIKRHTMQHGTLVDRINGNGVKHSTLNMRYARVKANVRPISAPNQASRRLGRKETMSARGNLNSQRRKTTTPDTVEDMFEIVRAARQAKEFNEDADYFRKLEQDINNPEGGDTDKKNAAPVFNKRLFASQGTVIITREARRLMYNNRKSNEVCDLETLLTKSEIQCLRCVTEGLKLIHKGHAFVKDVLSRVVTYELYKAFENVPCKGWEDELSCYYILNGAVEVTYDLRSKESRNVFQANIIYSHGTGEYLGLVNYEGPSEDLAPPSTIYTKELTQLIRVDRARFHKLMQKATTMVNKRKRDYVSSRSFFVNVASDVKEKILHKFTIQEYPANRVLLPQGELTEHLFIVMAGRCQTYREVYIPEADKTVLFYLTSRDPDDFFGEECLLDKESSFCTVVTATATTCLKLHRSALQMVNRDKLTRSIEDARHEFPSDQELRDRGYKDSVWNKYKHTQIKGSLKEDGKLQYLSRPTSANVCERPPCEQEQYIENMRRFVIKGSQMEPLRVQSARVRKQYHKVPLRPQTAMASQPTEVDNDSEHNKENETEECPVIQLQSTLMTVDKAKEMEKQIEKKRHVSGPPPLKAMESKETLMKILEEQGDHKHSWKGDNDGEETQNFMKNGVLVTMTSEDIVRKAKALADTYADKWKTTIDDNNDEEWDTILHAENKQAKMLISANRLRMKDLKRKLAELQKQREKTKLKYSPKKTETVTSLSDCTYIFTPKVEITNVDNTASDSHIELTTNAAIDTLRS